MFKPVNILVCCLIFTCACLVTAQNSQQLYPVDDEVYSALRALFLEQGLAPPFSSRPFSGGELREALNLIKKHELSAAGRKTYTYIESRLHPRTLYGEDETFAANASLEANLETYLHSSQNYMDWEYGYGKRLPLFRVGLEMWTAGFLYGIMDFPFRKDPFVVELKEDNYSNIFSDLGELDANFPYRAFLSAGGNHWNFRFGRDLYSWGNGKTGNFLLSDNMDFHEGIGFSTYWKAFKFSTVYFDLENWENETELAELTKAFIAHRMEFRFFRRFTFAISEGLIYEGKGSDIKFLNPFMVYHNYFLDDRYGNIVFSAEVNINPFRWGNLYGQLLLDTLTAEYEAEEYGENIPQANGYLLGIEGKIPAGPGYISGGFEWARADPWLYLIEVQPDLIVKRRFMSNYIGSRKLISSAIGYQYAPDADVFFFHAGYNMFGAFQAGSDVTIIDKGEIQIDTPYRSDREAAAMKAPSGLSEKKIVTHFYGKVSSFFLPGKLLSEMFSIGTHLYWIHIKNFDHTAGNTLNDFQWVFSFSVKL